MFGDHFPVFGSSIVLTPYPPSDYASIMSEGRNGRGNGMEIASAPATHAGQLDGYVWTCPQCGMEITSSLASSIALDTLQHVAWHNGREA